MHGPIFRLGAGDPQGSRKRSILFLKCSHQLSWSSQPHGASHAARRNETQRLRNPSTAQNRSRFTRVSLSKFQFMTPVLEAASSPSSRQPRSHSGSDSGQALVKHEIIYYLSVVVFGPTRTHKFVCPMISQVYIFAIELFRI